MTVCLRITAQPTVVEDQLPSIVGPGKKQIYHESLKLHFTICESRAREDPAGVSGHLQRLQGGSV